MDETLACCLCRLCGEPWPPMSPVLASGRSFFARKEDPRVEKRSLAEWRRFPENFSEESVCSSPPPPAVEEGGGMRDSLSPPFPPPRSGSNIFFLSETVGRDDLGEARGEDAKKVGTSDAGS